MTSLQKFNLFGHARNLRGRNTKKKYLKTEKNGKFYQRVMTETSKKYKYTEIERERTRTRKKEGERERDSENERQS